MRYDVTCPACGGKGAILLDHLADVPRCPTCGETFSLNPVPSPPDRPAADVDDILAWLSESDSTSSAPSSADRTCLACGYTGDMERESEGPGMVCPACQATHRPRTGRRTRGFTCPDCGTEFELSEPDRGKTIVCPACKHFLGCIWPPDKPRWRLFGSKA